MKKLKIAVFGATRGMQLVEKILLNHPEAELVGVCDHYQPLLDKAAAKAKESGLELKCFSNFDDMLSCDIDAVIIANCANAHAPYAIRALEAGWKACSQ